MGVRALYSTSVDLVSFERASTPSALCTIRLASSDIHAGMIYTKMCCKLCVYFHRHFTILRISNYQKRAFPKVVDIVEDFPEVLSKEASNAGIFWWSKNKSCF